MDPVLQQAKLIQLKVPTYTIWVKCFALKWQTKEMQICAIFFVFEVHAISTHASGVLEKIEYDCSTQHSTCLTELAL